MSFFDEKTIKESKKFTMLSPEKINEQEESEMMQEIHGQSMSHEEAEKLLDEIEDEEISEDDLFLVDLGIKPIYADGFKKKFPKRKVIYGGKLTKNFFTWYLDCCNQEELDMINIDKLPEGFAELVEKAEPATVATPDSEENKSLMMRYLNEIERLKEYVTFLYELDGELLGTIYSKTNVDFNLTNDQVGLIEKIKKELKL